MAFRKELALLCLASTVSAQYGSGGQYGGGRWQEGNNNNGDNDDIDNAFSRGPPTASLNQHIILLAHGILASLAFVIFFPLGSILIRLLPFRYTWLIHGVLQLFAYAVYIAAFGLGVYMLNNMPVDLRTSYHPVIGIILFVLLFFQPILGYVHHVKFRKHLRRTVWSHAHLWLGRGVITLGMINGGLGLLLASDAPAFTGFRPTMGQCVAYGVVAGVMWVVWAVAAVVGEKRRRRSGRVQKEKEVGSESDGGEAYQLGNVGTPPSDRKNHGGRVYG